LIQQCQRYLALDGRLAGVLAGDDKAANAGEQIGFGTLCQRKKLYLAAARFHRDAFGADVKLAENVPSNARYNAACCAALAACAQGNDGDKPDDAERGQWRQQALEWLQADLAWWAKALANDGKRSAGPVRQIMKSWQQDPDLAGVREKVALAGLPDAERNKWTTFWDGVEALVNRAQDKK